MTRISNICCRKPILKNVFGQIEQFHLVRPSLLVSQMFYKIERGAAYLMSTGESDFFFFLVTKELPQVFIAYRRPQPRM